MFAWRMEDGMAIVVTVVEGSFLKRSDGNHVRAGQGGLKRNAQR